MRASCTSTRRWPRVSRADSSIPVLARQPCSLADPAFTCLGTAQGGGRQAPPGWAADRIPDSTGLAARQNRELHSTPKHLPKACRRSRGRGHQPGRRGGCSGRGLLTSPVRRPLRAVRPRPNALTLQSRRLSQDSFEALREELEKTRAELSQARARIAAMEMSFFWKLRNAWWRAEGRHSAWTRSFGGSAAQPAADTELVHVPGFAPVRFRGHAFERSTDAVDVVVLAHDDLPVLEECLGALLRHARPPYRLFLADPGVSPAVRGWLETFAREQGAVLVGGADAFRRRSSAGTSRHVFLLDGRRASLRTSWTGWSPASPPTLTRPASFPSPPTFRARARRSSARHAALADGDWRARDAPRRRVGSALPGVRGGRRLRGSGEARGATAGGPEPSPREVLARCGARKARAPRGRHVGRGRRCRFAGGSDRVAAGIAARFRDSAGARRPSRERARRRFEGRRVLYVLPRPRARRRVERRAVGGARDDADGRRGTRLQPRGAPSRLREELSRAGRADRLRPRVGPRRGRPGVRRRDRDGALLDTVDGAARERSRGRPCSATASRTTSRSSTPRARKTGSARSPRTGSCRA